MAGDRDREVDHVAVGCGPVPVLHARLDEDHVAGRDRAAVAVAVVDPARAARDDEHLTAVVAVPVRARAGRERDAVDRDSLGLREHRIAPDRTGERRRTQLRRHPGTPALHHVNRHVAPLSVGRAG